MSLPSTISFETATAAMPAQQKSALRRMVERSMEGYGAGGSKVALAKLHLKAAGEGLRAGGESLLVGGGLGALHAHLPGGLDFKKVPIDAVAGALGLLAGTFAAQEEIGKDLANAGAAALAVFAFRKTNDLVTDMQVKRSGVTPGGGAVANVAGKTISKFGGEGGWANGSASDIGEDPIVRSARSM